MRVATSIECWWTPNPGSRLKVGVRFAKPRPFFPRLLAGTTKAIVDTGAPLSIIPLSVWSTDIPGDRKLIFPKEPFPPEFRGYDLFIKGLGSYTDAAGKLVGTIPCQFGYVELSLFDPYHRSVRFALPARLATRNIVEPTEDHASKKKGTAIPLILGVTGFLNEFRLELNTTPNGIYPGNACRIVIDPSIHTVRTIRDVRKDLSNFL